MKSKIVAHLWGLIFGGGLILAGVMRPQVIQGYLDVAGSWDPTLLLALCAAVAVYAPSYFWIRRRTRPLMSERFSLPARRAVDARLIGGAAIFGLGWGLAGMCPGANLVSLAHGGSALLFFGAWVSGLWVGDLFGGQRALSVQKAGAPQGSAMIVERA